MLFRSTCHIVALYAVDGGVLVGVLLLCLLVVALDQRQDVAVGGVGLAGKVTGKAIADIALGGLRGILLNDQGLYQLLDLLHRQGAADIVAVVLYYKGNVVNLSLGQLGAAFSALICLADRAADLLSVEGGLSAISLNDLHDVLLSFLYDLDFVIFPHFVIGIWCVHNI